MWRKVGWTPKIREKLKSKVRKIIKRTRGHSPKSVIAELATYLRGALPDGEALTAESDEGGINSGAGREPVGPT